MSRKLTLIAKDSKSGGCPAIYRTDDGRYVVQGPEYTDPHGLAELEDALPGERFVVIPERLARHLIWEG